MKVKITIEIDTAEKDMDKVVEQFKSDFDIWPGSGLYVDPWESAKISAEITEM